MNKTELVNTIAEKAEITKKDADKAMDAFIDTIKEELANGKAIQIIGFGTFDIVERSAREGRNPKTGEPCHIDSCKTPKFKPSKSLKDFVNV